jgi:hypothetical protein
LPNVEVNFIAELLLEKFSKFKNAKQHDCTARDFGFFKTRFSLRFGKFPRLNLFGYSARIVEQANYAQRKWNGCVNTATNEIWGDGGFVHFSSELQRLNTQ